MAYASSPTRSRYPHSMKIQNQVVSSPKHKVRSPTMKHAHSYVRLHGKDDTIIVKGHSARADRIPEGRGFTPKQTSQHRDVPSTYQPSRNLTSWSENNNIDRFEVALEKGELRGNITPKNLKTNVDAPFTRRIGHRKDPVKSNIFQGYSPRADLDVENKSSPNLRGYKGVDIIHTHTPAGRSASLPRRVSFVNDSDKPRRPSTDDLEDYIPTHRHTAVSGNRGMGNGEGFPNWNKQQPYMKAEFQKSGAHSRESPITDSALKRKVYSRSPSLPRTNFDKRDFGNTPNSQKPSSGPKITYSKPHPQKAVADDMKNSYTPKRHVTSSGRRHSFKSLFPNKNRYKNNHSHAYKDNLTSDAIVSNADHTSNQLNCDKTVGHVVPYLTNVSRHDKSISSAPHSHKSALDSKDIIFRTPKVHNVTSDERNNFSLGSREPHTLHHQNAFRPDKGGSPSIQQYNTASENGEIQEKSYLKIANPCKEGKYNRLYAKREASDTNITYKTELPCAWDKENSYSTDSCDDCSSKDHRAFCTDEKVNLSIPKNTAKSDSRKNHSVNVFSPFFSDTRDEYNNYHPHCGRSISRKRGRHSKKYQYGISSNKKNSCKTLNGLKQHSEYIENYKVPHNVQVIIDKNGTSNKLHPCGEGLENRLKHDTSQWRSHEKNACNIPQVYTASLTKRHGCEGPYAPRAASEDRHAKIYDNQQLHKTSSDTTAGYNSSDPHIYSSEDETGRNGSHRKTVSFKNADRLKLPPRQGERNNTILLHTASGNGKRYGDGHDKHDDVDIIESTSYLQESPGFRHKGMPCTQGKSNVSFENKTSSNTRGRNEPKFRFNPAFLKTRNPPLAESQDMDNVQSKALLDDSLDDGFITLYQSRTRENCPRCKQRSQSEPGRVTQKKNNNDETASNKSSDNTENNTETCEPSSENNKLAYSPSSENNNKTFIAPSEHVNKTCKTSSENDNKPCKTSAENQKRTTCKTSSENDKNMACRASSECDGPKNNNSAFCDQSDNWEQLLTDEIWQIDGNQCNHSDKVPEIKKASRLSLLRQSLASATGTDAEDGSPNTGRRKRHIQPQKTVDEFRKEKSSRDSVRHNTPSPDKSTRPSLGHLFGKSSNNESLSTVYANNEDDETQMFLRRKGSGGFDAEQGQFRRTPLTNLNPRGAKLDNIDASPVLQGRSVPNSNRSENKYSSSDGKRYPSVYRKCHGARRSPSSSSSDVEEGYSNIETVPYLTIYESPQIKLQTKSTQTPQSSMSSPSRRRSPSKVTKENIQLSRLHHKADVPIPVYRNRGSNRSNERMENVRVIRHPSPQRYLRIQD